MFMGTYQENVGGVGADEVLVPQDIKIAGSAGIGGYSIGEVLLYTAGAVAAYVLLKNWLYPSE